jgi:hypothetical protein
MYTRFSGGDLRKRDHWEDMDTEGMMVLLLMIIIILIIELQEIERRLQ